MSIGVFSPAMGFSVGAATPAVLTYIGSVTPSATPASVTIPSDGTVIAVFSVEPTRTMLASSLGSITGTIVDQRDIGTVRRNCVVVYQGVSAGTYNLNYTFNLGSQARIIYYVVTGLVTPTALTAIKTPSLTPIPASTPTAMDTDVYVDDGGIVIVVAYFSSILGTRTYVFSNTDASITYNVQNAMAYGDGYSSGQSGVVTTVTSSTSGNVAVYAFSMR